MATPSTTPTRFDAALFASAQAAGARNHRSAAHQLAHWARMGRELEASTGVSQRDIEPVLAGQMSYDNSSLDRPLRPIARYEYGQQGGEHVVVGQPTDDRQRPLAPVSRS